MTESNANNEQPEEPKRKFSQEQYDMLLRCSENGDMAEWNEWRKANAKVQVQLQGAKLEDANLQGADLGHAYLQGADLEDANLQGAHLFEANLQGAKLWEANLENAYLCETSLQGANLWRADLKGTDFNMASVDGQTIISRCQVDKDTDFTGVGLDSARVDPGLKQLLKYNIRRLGWKEWYEEHPFLRWPVQPFWWMSDYGRSTGRIVACFFALAVIFAAVYYICGLVAPPGIVDSLFEDQQGTINPGYVPLRALYFSVVTMTTLGFGDMHAIARGVCGHLLLMIQVLLGYVLLAALVTRFAVLFQAGGPAGKFARKDKD